MTRQPRHAGWFLLVVLGSAQLAESLEAAPPPPPADLPSGYELVVAAAPPLVNHPIMGCLDDRGRLFIGDAAGANLNKEGLEKELPNRVLLLEDTNGDGVFDRSSVFADRMTFPQGAVWLEGSLYVASPPGLWKLTDRDGDGVAEQREMIVGGFEYTGNAADVHGPFLHLSGRLYWCHGRKGHRVVQQDGTLVHEGLASGIWSCRPDGSDIQWHALSSADNPTEIDFTAEGEILGTVNLHYRDPRGDTIIHWLYGGVYERADQLKAIAGLPRTLKNMPVVHNFGHVAVSGCTLYRSGALAADWRGDMFVTHFNTSRLVRLEFARAGATYTATEREFLRLRSPDSHLTDVLEDADGSLLLLDTGGWFRIGCPSSLMEKPDLKGAVLRVRRKDYTPPSDPYGLKVDWERTAPAELKRLTEDSRWFVRQKAARLDYRPPPLVALADILAGGSPPELLRACEGIARSGRLDRRERAALLELLGRDLDPALEHGAMYAGIATRGLTLADLRKAKSPTLLRRLMVVIEQSKPDEATHDALLAMAREHAGDSDPELARTTVGVATRHPRAVELSANDFNAWLARDRVDDGRLNFLTDVVAAHLAEPSSQELLTRLLDHRAKAVRRTAWRILAGQEGKVSRTEWLPGLSQALQRALARTNATTDPDLPLLLEAISRLQSDNFDARLQAIASDTGWPPELRLKVLGAISRPGQELSTPAFEFLVSQVRSPASRAAGIEAARLLAAAKLDQAAFADLVPLFHTAGPVELQELLKLVRRAPKESGRAFAESLAQSPALGSIQQSVIKSKFSNFPPEVFEEILAPAIGRAEDARAARRQALESMAAAARKGRVDEGRKVFESGRGSCIACHQIGEVGRQIGPNMSHIGQIRKERDVLESILFPDATLARDYEAHEIETRDGRSLTGMIRRQTAEGLVLVDLAGQETHVSHGDVVSNHALTASFMPAGLENTLSEQELLDLVAWLVSLK